MSPLPPDASATLHNLSTLDVSLIYATAMGGWDGEAWAWDTDASVGYHDYMHFSYMGDDWLLSASESRCTLTADNIRSLAIYAHL